MIQLSKFSKLLDILIESGRVCNEDYSLFEWRLASNPEQGDPIQGSGGIRKTRLKSAHKGKSGGFRVFYLDIPEKEKLYFLFIMSKSVQADISKGELEQLSKLANILRKECRNEKTIRRT